MNLIKNVYNLNVDLIHVNNSNFLRRTLIYKLKRAFLRLNNLPYIKPQGDSLQKAISTPRVENKKEKFLKKQNQRKRTLKPSKDEKTEFKVERILLKRFNKKKECKEYLVK